MKEIPATIFMAIRVCFYHFVCCMRFVGVILGSIYVLSMGLAIWFDWPLNGHIIWQHKLTIYWVALAIYMVPVNLYVTHKILRGRFKNFRITTLDLES